MSFSFLAFAPSLLLSNFGLICFAHDKCSQQEQSVVSFGLRSWGPEGPREGLRNVPFWPHWASKSTWCWWSWSCVGPVPQGSNFPGSGAIGSVFVPPVPSEDQAHHPNSAFLELKQGQHRWHKWGQWWHTRGQLQIHFNRGISGGCSGRGLMKANVSCDQDAWSWLILSLKSKGLVSSVLWFVFFSFFLIASN